jgi:hypothetical protein
MDWATTKLWIESFGGRERRVGYVFAVMLALDAMIESREGGIKQVTLTPGRFSNQAGCRDNECPLYWMGQGGFDQRTRVCQNRQRFVYGIADLIVKVELQVVNTGRAEETV